jgi:ComF family protein
MRPGWPAGEPCALCEAYPPEFDRAVAALDYIPPWTPLIARLKFHETPALARPLGRLLAQAVRARGPCSRYTVVVPAPLSAERHRERGYNQAGLLAREVARALGLACEPEALHKRQHTARMMSLQSDERALQIRGAFSLLPDQARHLKGRDVALVDDVMTTGATLNELTRTLHAAGVRSVQAWVLARTPPPRSGDAVTAADEGRWEA